MDSDRIEEFDDDGNVLRVANLDFIQGVLGQGAFGTVRLARRKLPPKSPPLTPTTPSSGMMGNGGRKHGSGSSGSGGGGEAAPIPESAPIAEDAEVDAAAAAEDDGPPGGRGSRRYARPRKNNRALLKSVSAPSGSAFFDIRHSSPANATTSTSGAAPPTTPNNSSRHGKNISFFPSVASNNTPKSGESSSGRTRSNSVISRLAHSRSSIGEHEGHSNEEEEQLVAVKIFSKSILKRQRTMERDKSTRRVKVKTALQQVEREIALMKKLSHPNLVNMYDVIDSPESDMLYMVLEYMPGGEILTYQDDGTFRRKDPRPTSKSRQKIEGLVDGHFDEETAALYFVDILHGLAYLHQHHVCHRDLKPENILLDARGIAKVGDFGVSHIFEKEKDFTFPPPGTDGGCVGDDTGSTSSAALDDNNTFGSASINSNNDSDKGCRPVVDNDALPPPTPPPSGTPQILTRQEVDRALQMTNMGRYGLLSRTEGTWCFWSPEMCEGSHTFSGYAADMWAAGICLYIFVTGRLPFYSEVPTELFEQIAEAKISYDGLGLSNALVDLLKRALEKDPSKRFGVGDCLKHNFLELARDKRVKQLSSEFEISRKRKIVLSEDDIRAAFRIVTSVPVVLLRSASKTIQDGFRGARERLSMGTSSTGGNSSTMESSHHHRHLGKQIQEGIQGLKGRAARISHMNSHGSCHSASLTSTNPEKHADSKSSDVPAKSSDSTDKDTLDQDEKIMATGGSSDDSSSVLDGGARVVSIRRVHKMPSALSSTCSFASLSGDDDLGVILSEDDDDPNEVNKSSSEPASPSNASCTKQTDGASGEKSHDRQTNPNETETIEEVETAPKHRSKRKRTKRPKKSAHKDGSAKCIIQ